VVSRRAGLRPRRVDRDRARRRRAPVRVGSPLEDAGGARARARARGRGTVEPVLVADGRLLALRRLPGARRDVRLGRLVEGAPAGGDLRVCDAAGRRAEARRGDPARPLERRRRADPQVDRPRADPAPRRRRRGRTVLGRPRPVRRDGHPPDHEGGSMEYVSPFDEAVLEATPLAPRPESLAGRTVALLDITKNRGAETFRISKETFSRPAAPEVIEEIALRGDLVVEGLAD